MSTLDFAAGVVIGVIISMLATNTGHTQQLYNGPASVHDGDTITVNKQPFRLFGIDAPELNERGGLEARLEMLNIINNDTVQCVPTGQHSYKRLVGICFTSHYPDVGAELIRRGHALDCERYSLGVYRHLEPTNARQKLSSKGYCK